MTNHLRMKSKLVSLTVCLAILQGCGQPSSTPPPKPSVEEEKTDGWAGLRKMAEGGDAAAQSKLGHLYFDGDGVNNDAVKAVKWWQRAAKQGDPDAQGNLASALASGEGVTKDNVKAMEWAQKAAEQGNAVGQRTVGSLYFGGDGVPQDVAKGLEWYQKAAAQGDVETQTRLGRLYSSGAGGVPEDSAIAMAWWQKAAAQGFAGAQVEIGLAYSLGKGVPLNEATALEWWHKAAAQGDPSAQSFIAGSYATGSGVPKDAAKAVEWWQKAAAQGEFSSQQALGSAYERGDGVAQDLVLSYAWLNIAAAKESRAVVLLGMWDVAAQARDKVARMLRPEQIAEAQRLSSTWKVGQVLVREGRSAVTLEPAGTGTTLSKVGTGTAFFVGNSGVALTANHVVKGCAEVRAEGHEGVVKVVTADPANDIALLQFPGPVTATAVLNKAPDQLRQGEEIVVFGFPLNSVLSSGGNLTPGIVSALTGLGNNTNQLQITAPVQPGSSGSAVLNKKGEVVGMVTMKISDSAMVKETGQIPQNVNFAMNGQTISAFLAANQVEYRAGGFLVFEKSASELADEARKWTLVAECWK